MLLKKNIKFLIVHCSDTGNDNNISALDIHRMHLSFGWDGIGYHKIIKRNGEIENGRPEFWIGAHTYGMNNVSLGVCLIGSDLFTPEQLNSLRLILDKWKLLYPNVIIKGHRDIIETNKTCPNFDVLEWYNNNVIK